MERTFAIIKPDAVAAGNAGKIIALIEQSGFKILGMKKTRLSRPQAEGFYAVHKAKPFFFGSDRVHDRGSGGRHGARSARMPSPSGAK